MPQPFARDYFTGYSAEGSYKRAYLRWAIPYQTIKLAYHSLDLPPPRSCLDLGAADGRYLRYLDQKFGFEIAEGLEISPYILAKTVWPQVHQGDISKRRAYTRLAKGQHYELVLANVFFYLTERQIRKCLRHLRTVAIVARSGLLFCNCLPLANDWYGPNCISYCGKAGYQDSGEDSFLYPRPFHWWLRIFAEEHWTAVFRDYRFFAFQARSATRSRDDLNSGFDYEIKYPNQNVSKWGAADRIHGYVEITLQRDHVYRFVLVSVKTDFIWQETGPTKVICKKHQLAQRVRDLPRLISLFRSGELGSFHHLKFLPTTKYTYIYGTRSELSELSISNKPLFTYYSSDVEF